MFGIAMKPGSTFNFLLKCPVPSHEYNSCYLTVRFYVGCIEGCFGWTLSVSVLPLLSSYSWCISLGFSYWHGFVFSQSIYDFWTAVY